MDTPQIPDTSQSGGGVAAPPVPDTGWMAAAKAPPPAPQTQSPNVTATIPDQAESAQHAPTVLRPVPHGGIRGMLDKVLDSIAGTERPEIYEDQEGNKYIQHPQMTRGQQWMRIGAEGLRGAAAGLAAGRGHGGGAALEAGVQQGQQMQQAQTQQEKDQQLEVANSQALKHQQAAQALAMTRMQVEGAQHDIEFSEKRSDWLKSNGGEPIGHVTDLGEVAQLMRETPGFSENQAKHDIYETVPQFTPDGKANGFTVYRMERGWGDEMAPPGTTIHFFNPVSGTMETQKTSDWKKKGDINTIENAAGVAAQAYALKNAEIEEKKQATATGAENEKKTAQEVQFGPAKAAADIAEKNSAAYKNTQEGKKAATEAETEPGLIDAIGRGQMPPGRLAYLLARKPELLSAVSKSYPDFDASKVESYAGTYKDFTSGKTSVALNAGGTALGHLAELKALNTPMSHVPHTPAWTAYQNKAETVATELAKFYGDSTIPGIAGIKDTLTSTLPGNRDKAISTQAQSMGDKLDAYEQTWKNAAPSKVYEAPMPGISAKALEARAALDPNYAKRSVKELQAGAPPSGATLKVPGNDGKFYWSNDKHENLGPVQ